MSREPVRYEVEKGVARLTLDRPQALNALDLALLRQLGERAREAVADDSVGALLLTGAGPAFCAGGDVRALRELADAPSPREVALAAVGEMHETLLELFRCPKPVVAAVNGATAGAGIGLMLTADLIWASKSASFTLAFTALGASPDGGTTFLLPRVVGPKRAGELLLTNRRLDAQAALEAGLVGRVLEDEALLPRAEAMCARLAAGPAAAFASAKELLRRSVYQGYEAQLEEERQRLAAVSAGAEFREGVAAFLEKRPPRFRPG